MKKKEKFHPTTKAMDAVKAYRDEPYDKTDPNGSYTGFCENKEEKPVQDADDL